MPQLMPLQNARHASPIYSSLAGDEAITPRYTEILGRDRVAALLQSEYLRSQALFLQASSRLEELSRLHDNWDSYRAVAPNVFARETAAEILNILKSMALPPTRLVPSAEGGVGICFAEGDRYADIECLNTGEILAVIYRGKEEPNVWKIQTDGQSIQAAIEQIRAHFSA